MSEDTKLQQLIINTLSPEQFEPITPSDTEIYLVEDDAEYATVEELATKQDVINDLGDIRNNIATNTSNISYLDEKVRDIELFKFPNAVIIGEPTISNGQVSGFSADNYMQFPFILDLHNTPFQIDFAFTTGNNVTTQQNILDSEFGLALAIANGKGLMAISGNGTSWNIGSSVGTIAIQPNTTYYARLTWDGMQYKTLISTNGTDYTQDMYLVGTQSPYPRTIFIGGCSGSVIGHTPHPFFGTINMNKAYLSTRGQVIWQGMDDAGLVTRADISLSNLDELGEKRFTDKQDVISDLDTIRAGASKGATAIQQVKTINGESIVGSGNITIKSAPDLDNVTISKNSNDELQAIALIEDNKTYKPTDFAKADELNNKVNKSGDTMTGDLHFNRSSLDTTIVPTSTIYSTPIGIYDKNNVLTGYIQITQRSNGQILTGINAHKIVDGTDKYTGISVGFDSSGNAFCEFPNTKNVDGQWVHSRKILLDNVTISAKTEVDLSTYLPTNNFNYDVMFSFVASTDNTSGHWYQAMITSDIITEDVIIAACTRAGAVQNNGGCAIIPISTSRKVYISKLGTSNMLGAYFIVNAYRRIGTNG